MSFKEIARSKEGRLEPEETSLPILVPIPSIYAQISINFNSNNVVGLEDVIHSLQEYSHSSPLKLSTEFIRYKVNEVIISIVASPPNYSLLNKTLSLVHGIFAYSSNSDTSQILQPILIQSLVKYLQNPPNNSIFENSLRCLANISGGTQKERDLVMHEMPFPLIETIISSPLTAKLIHNFTLYKLEQRDAMPLLKIVTDAWGCSNGRRLCDFAYSVAYLRQHLFPDFLKVFDDRNLEAVVYTGFSSNTEDTVFSVASLVVDLQENGYQIGRFLPFILSFLNSSESLKVSASCRVIESMCTNGSDISISLETIQSLCYILMNATLGARIDALNSLCAVLNYDRIPPPEQLLSSNLLRDLVDFYSDCPSFSLKKVIVQALDYLFVLCEKCSLIGQCISLLSNLGGLDQLKADEFCEGEGLASAIAVLYENFIDVYGDDAQNDLASDDQL